MCYVHQVVETYDYATYKLLYFYLMFVSLHCGVGDGFY